MTATNSESRDHKVPYMGRKRIYTSYDKVDASTVEKVITEVMPTHRANASQMTYLWNYYKGDQPVLYRVKESRPEICNNVVENRAQECVQFKLGYQLGEPMQYNPASDEDTDPSGHEEREDGLVNNVRILNRHCKAVDKASLDRDLFEWMLVCGVGERMVRAEDTERGDGESPFSIFTLDPRQAFVIHGNDFDRKRLAAVYIGYNQSGSEIVTVYTDSAVFRKDPDAFNGAWVEMENELGIVIFEYELNNARQGVFEPALPLLDSINTIESNRVDGIQQTVDGLLVFDNVDIDSETFASMRESGALKIRSYDGVSGKVYYVECNLDQNQTQTTIDAVYSAFTAIVGMPNNSKQAASSSDTGTAVMLRDGWTLAESHAKSYELKWKKSERDFLRMLLDICRTQTDKKVDLRVCDIEMAFNRRNYENVLVKAQTLTTMLNEPRIDPALAFEKCGLFDDPTSAYLQSKAHYESVKDEEQEPQGGGMNAYDEQVQRVSEMNSIAQTTGIHPQ